MNAPTVLAIDPGNTESAYALIDLRTRRPLAVDKLPNDDLLALLHQARPGYFGRASIEMVASYGMAVGKDVFETCVWIGRYQQALLTHAPETPVALTYRRDVKLHHCHSSKAKDSNIAQALVDRFAPDVRNRGKGTKAEPGWFYGFHADIWQAYALAVLSADTHPDPVDAAAVAAGATSQAGAPF